MRNEESRGAFLKRHLLTNSSDVDFIIVNSFSCNDENIDWEFLYNKNYDLIIFISDSDKVHFFIEDFGFSFLYIYFDFNTKNYECLKRKIENKISFFKRTKKIKYISKFLSDRQRDIFYFFIPPINFIRLSDEEKKYNIAPIFESVTYFLNETLLKNSYFEFQKIIENKLKIYFSIQSNMVNSKFAEFYFGPQHGIFLSESYYIKCMNKYRFGVRIQENIHFDVKLRNISEGNFYCRSKNDGPVEGKQSVNIYSGDTIR